MARYVIVGAGPAGVIAAETLRKVDAEGDIVLIGGEPEPPYSRMAIPYYLTGGIEEAGTYLRKVKGTLTRSKQQKEWQTYLSNLREQNRRKPRCIEVLDGLAGKRIIDG